MGAWARPRRATGTLVGLVLCAACGPASGSHNEGENAGRAGAPGTPPPAAQPRDSAGIPIVLNPAEAPPGGGWRLSEEPLLEIGVADGAPQYTLYQVSRGVVLGDGRIVLANRGTEELRFYDAAGRHLRSVGGEGDGPGEFRSLLLVGTFAGDSLLVLDFTQRRISIYDPQGGLARTFPVPAEVEGSPGALGVLSDGSLVLRSVTLGEESGAFREPTPVYVVSPEGGAARLLDEFPGQDRSVIRPQGGGYIGQIVLFGRNVYVAASGDRIAIGTNDAYSIRVYDGAGSVLRLVRQAREAVPVDPADFDLFHQVRMEQQRAAARPEAFLANYEAGLRQMPRHGTLPAFGALRIDRRGHLWVEEYRPICVACLSQGAPQEPVSPTTRSWQVFDGEGVLRGRIELPASVTVLDSGEDYLLAVHRDPLGVERVRLHGLERGS